jgi:hypothetical protein
MPKKANQNPIEALNAKRDLAREAAVENSPVRMDGAGESDAIKHIFTDLPTANNLDALNMALLLQQIVRGNASILDNIDKQNKESALLREDLRRLQAKMDAYDKDAERWERDRKKFIDDSFDEGERTLRRSKKSPAELQALAVKQAQEARAEAAAESAHARLVFEEQCRTAPKVQVISSGLIENGKIVPEVVRIKNKQWVLPPGQAIEVPDFVAARYYQMKRDQMEWQERSAALSVERNNGAMSEYGDVQRKMAEIDQKYQTNLATA